MITKRHILYFLPFMLTPGAYAASSPGGTVKFNGEIKAQTCSVVSADENQVINLPSVSVDSLNSNGKIAGSKVFTIRVEKCPSTLTSVTAHFEANNGTTGYDVLTHNLTNVFQGTPSTTPPTSAAQNVQIRLFDKGGASQVQVGGTDGQFVQISGGEATMEYVASYFATAPAVAGYVTATVAYSLAYN